LQLVACMSLGRNETIFMPGYCFSRHWLPPSPSSSGSLHRVVSRSPTMWQTDMVLAPQLYVINFPSLFKVLVPFRHYTIAFRSFGVAGMLARNIHIGKSSFHSPYVTSFVFLFVIFYMLMHWVKAWF
jgi:hypothetical protein